MNLHLKIPALFAALAMLASCAIGHNVYDSRKDMKIGAQLYTVRAEMESDFEGTLRQIKAIGYDQVEFAGLYGRDPVEVRNLLDDIGLQAPSSHIWWERIRDNPEAAIAETKALGAQYMVFAWLPPEERDTVEDWRRWIDRLNKVGKMAKAQGLQLAYHNHAFEFEAIDGVRPYDVLLKELDPELVKMELDLYWMVFSGERVENLYAVQAGRFPLLHIKNMQQGDNAMVDTGAMVDIGTGQIDFETIFSQNRQGGVRYIFVEHDNAENPMAFLENSLTYLRGLRK